jgi:small GTP-binding protein
MQATKDIDDNEVAFNLWDTAGQEGYERLRTLSYPETDIFLLCFCIDNEASLKNIEAKWWPEVGHHCPDGKFILVGLKGDLRDDSGGKTLVTTEQINAVASKIDAIKYLECSAKKQVNVDEVFVEAARAILGYTPKTASSKKHSKKCTIL